MLKLPMNHLNIVTSEVWSLMANTSLELSDIRVTTAALNGHVASSVQIVGAWEGSLHLEMNLDMAKTTTARLLGANEADVSPEDIQDAVGELANMLCGGVKELMPQPCKLSLPSVAIGVKRKPVNGCGRIMSECSFVADSGLLHVSVVERNSNIE
jgi:chemotaxis protein CheX